MGDPATKLTVVRNAAEDGFISAWAARRDALPGDATVAKARTEAMARFEAHGLPNRRVEEWKYTDLRAAIKEALPLSDDDDASVQAVETAIAPLLATGAARMTLVDGHYAPNLSNPETAGDAVLVTPLASALEDDAFAAAHAHLPTVPQHDTTVALNTALMTDGVAIHVQATPERPLHIVHVMKAGTPALAVTRNVLSVADGVSVTLIETYVSLEEAGAQVNSVTQVGVGANANVRHVKLQAENRDSTHLASWVVDLAASANYQAVQMTIGGALTRNQVYLTFNGPDAEAHINGAYLQRGNQHCDTTLVIDHIHPGCTSRETFKGVLDDQARGVFQGKIMVKPEAQKTDGKQMAQALLLSEEAEFDSKPELEIFADDVVCGHGSTSGAIDDELLFYLRARGIPEKKARALLVQAFVGEALELIEDEEELHGALMALAAEWLDPKST
ncbi:MAG: Fe-S cluster assembly protein SufD [Pseudomonadota bacterium]